LLIIELLPDDVTPKNPKLRPCIGIGGVPVANLINACADFSSYFAKSSNEPISYSSMRLISAIYCSINLAFC
jgi:hypothetical protein